MSFNMAFQARSVCIDKKKARARQANGGDSRGKRLCSSQQARSRVKDLNHLIFSQLLSR